MIDALYFAWYVFIHSIELLGYLGLLFFAYMIAIIIHEWYVKKRIQRETRQELHG